MKALHVILSLVAFASVHAQTESEIRAHYIEVGKQIIQSSEGEGSGSLYNNSLEINKYSEPWPGVGSYHERIDFWYNEAPNHVDESEKKPKDVLVKVIVSRTSAEWTAYEEFLYKEGSLIFYFKRAGEADDKVETRVYFNDKGSFKMAVRLGHTDLTPDDFLTEEFKNLKPTEAPIVANGKKYQQLFLNSMK